MADHPTPCGCFTVCGDLEEKDDDPRAVCRGLPMPPRDPLVRVVLLDRRMDNRPAHS